MGKESCRLHRPTRYQLPRRRGHVYSRCLRLTLPAAAAINLATSAAGAARAAACAASDTAAAGAS